MEGNKCVGNCKGYAREDNINMIIPEGCSPENFDYPEPILAW
ncbi:unnamed protein product [Brassica napus]|uniref:(rape) hypothetical protein n=1 Tax=Brassica napus TaxID=3708 RepID=A0A816XDA0_BRANA|nr:unnamed protein product [Brassica napus]